MMSDEETNMQYLMTANIQDGIIEETLPYLINIEERYEKYCIKNHNLILSKNGAPYKIAVANIKKDQKILANGNLYIIEIDEEKANPYYIKAFFESETGIAALKSITVGSTILSISVDKLKKLQIPLPLLDEQNKIAENYQAIQAEIIELKARLKSAVESLKTVFTY